MRRSETSRSFSSRALFGALILCTGALTACQGEGSDKDPADPINADQTLRLQRLGNGNYQYCDANGDCTELPPTGSDCAILEIRIDTQTGTTCQTCIFADGTTVDQGCSSTAVACTVVTIPEPDCVVCAYVNGAVIYSSCNPTEPQCRDDSDCATSGGLYGYCDGGQCIYEPHPECTSDADCRDGEVCVFDVCPAMPCSWEDHDGDGEVDDDEFNCPPCYGQCRPTETEYDCRSNDDCNDDEYCNYEVCTAGAPDDRACAPGTDCNGGCYGSCTPIEYNPCAAVLCGPGHHCEVQEVWCVQAPCPPQAVCVPNDPPYGCQSDADCGRGSHCVIDACTDMACNDENPECNTCWGHCEPWGEYCGSEFCPVGTHCEREEIVCITEPCLPIEVCVPDAPNPCAAVDCAPGYECKWEEIVCITEPCFPHVECVPVGPFNCDESQIFCDMVAPECQPGYVHSVEGHCYGPCVPEDTCAHRNECDSNEDCHAGESCMFLCVDCMPNSPGCIGGCFGQCVADPSDDCFRSGCSGQFCTDEPVFSTCEWQEEYACYNDAICERGSDGGCGWRQTETLRECLGDNGGGGTDPGTGGGPSGGNGG